MTILVTGSAGHLGEAVMRVLTAAGRPARGLDIKPSPFTDLVGSIADREIVRTAMAGVGAVIHAATLHKPHVATHAHRDFVDTNISGTLALLEEAAAANAKAFVFTSTTSAFGSALTPPPGMPAAWIDETVEPVAKNIYGVTKIGAEALCELYARRHGLPVVILRTSRFFPEPDDDPQARLAFATPNLQLNELLHRRVDLADVVDAHLMAIERARELGFARFIVSATTPFARDDLAELRRDAAGIVRRLFPEVEAIYAQRGWRLPASLDRVYDSAAARAALGWRPVYTFAAVLERLRRSEDVRSDLAIAVGAKGYHADVFAEGPYPVA